MLTEERVLNTSWACRESRHHSNFYAKFEVLEVAQNGKLGIYVYWLEAYHDTSELDDLDLDMLEELVQKRCIVELEDVEEVEEDENAETMIVLALLAAAALALVGAFTFYAGIHGNPHPQKPWEVGIGAACMIAAVLAVALRRT